MKSFLLNVLKYMANDGFYAYVNNDFITAKNNVIPGCVFEPLMEGNGIKPENGEELFCLQYSTIFLLNPHVVKLKRNLENEWIVDREIVVATEACGYKWVAVTSNEAVVAIAPICEDELDYALFKKTLSQAKQGIVNNWYSSRVEDSLKLGEFLYKYAREHK